MVRQVRLLHSVPASQLNCVLQEGLKATSEFDDLGLEMRRGVVYCWLRKEHDRMWGQRPDYVYVEVTVDEDRCRVAEMEFSSLAMMYIQGAGRPKNERAARLLAELYEVTSLPLADYREGMFSTPEVLVKGDLRSDCIRPVQSDKGG